MKWSAEDERALRHLYPHHSNQYLSQYFGCSYSAIKNRATKLGLSKSPEYLASKPGCFRRGQESWNKGMKGLDIGGKETRFKKGDKPHNTMSIGSYRINKDGHLQQKISEARGSNSMRWRSVHELVWSEVNGLVPERHICVFKSGMKTNILEEITIDRVECISLDENMRRNTIHNYPPEIVEVTRLRGVLTRHINKRARV